MNDLQIYPIISQIKLNNMKKLPVHFTITVPVTHLNTLPPIHVGDVEVQAQAYQYADGSMLLDDEDERPEVDIDAILFNGNNITGLIEAVAPDYYEELKTAAGEYAKHFETVKTTQHETV